MLVVGLVAVFVEGFALLLGVFDLFEEVGVEDGGGDLVVAGGPLAEIEEAAAVGAEGEVGVGGEDDFAAGGAEEGFGCGHGRVMLILPGTPGRRH